METPRGPNLRRMAVLGVVFLVVSIALLFWARDLVREVVVLPVSYLIFVFGVLVDYTPQIFFWILVLLIGARIAFLSVSRKKRKGDDEIGYAFRPLDDRTAISGRVLFWANKVNLLRYGGGAYYSRSFHAALSKTLFQLLAYRNRLTHAQVEEGLKDGTLPVPPEIREYALQSLDVEETVNEWSWAYFRAWITTSFRKALYRLKSTFNNFAGESRSLQPQASIPAGPEHSEPATQRAAAQFDPIDERVRRVLIYMQEELEVPHDNTGH